MPTELPLTLSRWRYESASGRSQRQPSRALHRRRISVHRDPLPTRLLDAGAVASIGSVGDSSDNAMAESVIGPYKNECIRIEGQIMTVDELELATPVMGALAQRGPAALFNRLHPTSRVQTDLLPPNRLPTAPAAGRTSSTKPRRVSVVVAVRRLPFGGTCRYRLRAAML
jgi:transposase InsO family protein